MKLAILDALTYGNADLTPLNTHFQHVDCYPITQEHQMLERLKGVDVAVANKAIFGESLLKGLPNLKLICVAATGVNNVDLAAARACGIPVVNVPGYSTPAVVSHTLSMYFHLAHHNEYHSQYTRSGGWCKSPTFTHLDRPWTEMHGRTWGIIGMGAIGSGVARAVEALGCSVCYHSPTGHNLHQPWPHQSLADLLACAEVVSIHTPLNQKTHNLMNYQTLCMMRPDAILINTARGGIVNEGHLARALDEGLLAGAALDVLEKEPPSPDNPLFSMKDPHRLFLTPHIAGLSAQSLNRLIAETAANIQAFFQGMERNRVGVSGLSC